MEQIKCTECGTMFNVGLTECPSCGCPVLTEDSQMARNELNIETNTMNNEIGTSDSESPNIFNNEEKTTLSNTKKKISINYLAIVSLLIGIAIVCLGVTVKNKEVDGLPSTYSAQKYDVGNYSFGADFYTEIYEASNTIVDELSSIDAGIGALSSCMDDSIRIVSNTINFAVGMGIIAIGLGIIAISCIHLMKQQ